MLVNKLFGKDIFPRQWFPYGSQIGLDQEAIKFEHSLSLHKFNECFNIIKKNNDKDKRYWRRLLKRAKHIYQRVEEYKLSGKKRPIYLHWQNFWSDMNTEDCQILDFLKNSNPEIQFRLSSSPKQADVIISSCYGKEKFQKKFDHCLRILFLGENVRPQFDNYDFSLTSDLNSYRGRNIYLPLWLFEVDLFERNFNYNDRKIHKIDLFTKKKKIDFSTRKSSIVYVGNNCEPFRESIIRSICDEPNLIETYGSHSKPIENKVELLKKYKATLALENSYYPGYITEKGIQAYLGGAKTFYWGCLKNSPFEGHPLFVNLETTQTSDEIIYQIKNVINENKIMEIPPLFTENYITNIKSKLLLKMRNIFAQFLV